MRDDTVTIWASSLSRVWVSTGERRHTLLGSAIGALVLGAGVGLAATGANDSCEPDCLVNSSDRRHLFWAGAVPGSLLGMLLGGFIGHGTVSRRWLEIPLPVAVSVLPDGRPSVVFQARRNR